MPRFYFHLQDGVTVCDEDGLIFDTVEEARQEAIRSARSIMADDVKKGRLTLADRILITDENGNKVMVVPFASVIRIYPPQS